MIQMQPSVTPFFMNRSKPANTRLRWSISPGAAALLLLIAANPVNAKEINAGAQLAKLIEENNCILRKDNQIAQKLAEAEISIREFQQQTAALFADGYLRSEENGQVLRLVGWGDCK